MPLVAPDQLQSDVSAIGQIHGVADILKGKKQHFVGEDRFALVRPAQGIAWIHRPGSVSPEEDDGVQECGAEIRSEVEHVQLERDARGPCHGWFGYLPGITGSAGEFLE